METKKKQKFRCFWGSQLFIERLFNKNISKARKLNKYHVLFQKKISLCVEFIFSKLLKTKKIRGCRIISS